MRLLNERLSFMDVMIIFIIASVTFMFIPAWLPFLRKDWVLLVLITPILLFYYRSYMSTKANFALILYGIVLIINVLFGDAYIDSIPTAIYEFLMLFVTCTLGLYCTRSRNIKFINTLVFITFVALIFQAVASSIILQSNPGIIRGLQAMAVADDNSQIVYNFYKFGMMDYIMAHALPILIPPLFFYFKEGSKKVKLIGLALMIVCFAMVFMSESSTAVLVIILMLMICFFIKPKASFKKNVFIVSFFVIVAILLLSVDTLMLNIFDLFKGLVEEDSLFYARLEELQLSIIEDQTTGDLEGRFIRYSRSTDLFFSNFLLGSNEMPGRHSGILDRLAVVGIVGFVPVALFFFFSLKSIWFSIPQNRRIYYLVCIMAAFLMLLFKAMWLWTIFLFLFVITPCMLIMYQDKN